MLDMGHHTMLDAMKKIPVYEYLIGDCGGKSVDDNIYLKTLLGNKMNGKHTVHISVDKDDFEKEITKLGYKITYKGHDRPPSTPFG